ncbi:MAG: Hsp20/alpha crystallin family protein [Pyrobaculum arsenaticum]|uniref:Heat shock protein Hsp20 n=2 Tax=Pyrobaculum arsenaticum TaxID=121277 RepID=A4WLE3_PYRAR|nr:archaeal heat shock protein Hsp20 [Pyrobaculum arsenaticum]ABP51210.1 heat shock protein Hsp20 [Pyrobaculum arsenaticum DSM 13514]MCY0889977.1 Hsp20/alpha crystallin family protein [Pyrobaculum arsenaticum]NYR15066.1 Hsp20/alpha crystallin family protein [Pyrobaculum arsenaticum]
MSIFDEFERFMRRWQKFFEEIERQIEEDFKRLSSPGVSGGRPRYYYYGFEITMGPDGKPVVREFGNVRRRPDMERIEVVDEIDPLTDIVEEDDKIKVVVDMPGVEKEDIKLYVSEDGRTLTIDAKGKDRKYHKEIRLPAAVDPSKAKASYKNGVLSVELEKTEKKKRGFEIKID